MILYNIIYIYVYYIIYICILYYIYIYIYTLVCLRSCRKAPQVQVGLINPPNCRDIHFFSTQDHWMMEPLDPRAEQCRAQHLALHPQKRCGLMPIFRPFVANKLPRFNVDEHLELAGT